MFAYLMACANLQVFDLTYTHFVNFKLFFKNQNNVS